MARARNSGMRTYTQADVDELVAESAKDKKNVIEAMGYSFNDSDDFLENLNILGGTVDFFLPCINLIRIVDNSCCALSAIELQFLGARKDL